MFSHLSIVQNFLWISYCFYWFNCACIKLLTFFLKTTAVVLFTFRNFYCKPRRYKTFFICFRRPRTVFLLSFSYNRFSAHYSFFSFLTFRRRNEGFRSLYILGLKGLLNTTNYYNKTIPAVGRTLGIYFTTI